VRRADQILVIEAGRIVERGTHESLYAAGGRYYELYTKQHGVETNLFLAPGESSVAEEVEISENEPASSSPNDTDLPNAIRLLRGPGN
jgi:subfamily B ATP-binding cassette protein MsbA